MHTLKCNMDFEHVCCPVCRLAVGLWALQEICPPTVSCLCKAFQRPPRIKCCRCCSCSSQGLKRYAAGPVFTADASSTVHNCTAMKALDEIIVQCFRLHTVYTIQLWYGAVDYRINRKRTIDRILPMCRGKWGPRFNSQSDLCSLLFCPKFSCALSV